jgi:hypothetical protein
MVHWMRVAKVFREPLAGRSSEGLTIGAYDRGFGPIAKTVAILICWDTKGLASHAFRLAYFRRTVGVGPAGGGGSIKPNFGVVFLRFNGTMFIP